MGSKLAQSKHFQVIEGEFLWTVFFEHAVFPKMKHCKQHRLHPFLITAAYRTSDSSIKSDLNSAVSSYNAEFTTFHQLSQAPTHPDSPCKD